MGLFEINKSSDPISAMVKAQKLKNTGGPVRLSKSQIVALTINLPDAEKNLEKDEFDRICAIYDLIRKDKQYHMMDVEGYVNSVASIAEEFEKIAPFLLMDGIHSKDMDYCDQLQARYAHMDGISYLNACDIYKTYFSYLQEKKKFKPLRYAPFANPRIEYLSSILMHEAEAAERFYDKYFETGIQRRWAHELFNGVTEALFLRINNPTPEQDMIVSWYLADIYAEGLLKNHYIEEMMKERRKYALEMFHMIAGQKDREPIVKVMGEYLHKQLTDQGYNSHDNANLEWIARVYDRLTKEGNI